MHIDILHDLDLVKTYLLVDIAIEAAIHGVGLAIFYFICRWAIKNILKSEESILAAEKRIIEASANVSKTCNALHGIEIKGECDASNS